MMRVRRGYTLVEALVVIALITVTLTITALMMHSLYRGGRRIDDDLDAQRIVNQLSHQLRCDAHEASNAVMEQDADSTAPHKVKLALTENRSIQYAVLPNRIERVVYRNTEIEHRETFRIVCPDGYWSMNEDGERPLLTLHLCPDGEPAAPRSDRTQVLIHAAVGISALSVGS